MNRIWAPWRISYVACQKQKGCIFCTAFKEKRDRKNLVVFRSFYCFVLLNIFPYNNGHLLVVPNRHIESPENLTEQELLDMDKTLIKMISILKKVLHPDGFNVGMNIGKVSGAGIDKHLHTHLVARWLGDTNFMPVLADTKIISQSLKELYVKIIKEIKEESQVVTKR